MGAKINLSEATVFTLRGTDIKVYPATLAKIEEITPILDSMEKAEKGKNIAEQIKIYQTLVYTLIKDDNPDLNEKTLSGILTVNACIRIVQTATGVMAGLIDDIVDET